MNVCRSVVVTAFFKAAGIHIVSDLAGSREMSNLQNDRVKVYR